MKRSASVISISDDDHSGKEDDVKVVQLRTRDVIDSHIRLNSCRSLAGTQYNKNAASLSKIMGHGSPSEIFHFNYMIDLAFLEACAPANAEITLIAQHLFSEETDKRYKHIEPKLPFPFGTHHTKAIVMFYPNETMRIVIHTSNIIMQDWTDKTQGLWISPVLSLLGPTTGGSADAKAQRFGNDFTSYLRQYNDSTIFALAKRIGRYDFSSCKAIIIGSIPGRHTGASIEKWGHPRLRNVIREVCKNDTKGDMIILQFSSVGSFNEKWLQSEFFESLKGNSSQDTKTNAFNSLFKNAVPKTKKEGGESAEKVSDIACKIIYPTVTDVRNSCEGWGGGSCLPYGYDNWCKQRPFISKFMNSWNSKRQGRSRCMPHIKTYTRMHTDGSGRMDWFLLTSSNLSKAAWGQLEKGGSQLYIRSYELGVFVAPQLFEEDNLAMVASPMRDWVDPHPNGNFMESVGVISQIEVNKPEGPNSSTNSKQLVVPLPYDIPLTPYSKTDEAYTKDRDYNEPDIFGFTSNGTAT